MTTFELAAACRLKKKACEFLSVPVQQMTAEEEKEQKHHTQATAAKKLSARVAERL